MTALERVIDALAARNGAQPRKAGAEWVALCPAHDDTNPSLYLREGNSGNVVLTCRSRGCDPEEIVAAIDLTMADLFDQPRENRDRPRVVATYRYEDENGQLLYVVERLEPGHDGKAKSFLQVPASGKRGRGAMAGVRRALYRLPQVVEAVKNGATVYVVEGEKDADAMVATGAVATCNPGGASKTGKWRPEYGDTLRGADVVVIADRDEVGRAHARAVAADLDGKAASVRIVEPVEGKDAADHLAAGHSLDELVDQVLDNEPPAEEVDDQRESWPSLLQDGGTFLFAGPADVEPTWGRDEEVIWAEGEALIIVGPSGVGKTTLAGQIVRARLGLVTQVLGYPVKPTVSKVLYLALDRPRQIRRALLRQFPEHERAVVTERLVVWKGPPPSDLAKHPGMLLALARQAGADTVIVDSLKDAFLGLTDDEAAAGYNRARQTALVNGVEVLELHHQTKRGPNSALPTTLADVYGSVWITAGAGSVILLWGAAGDLIVQLRHLKQPAAEVGPFHILHDHDHGTSSIYRAADLARLAAIAGPAGLTVKTAAAALFDTDKPTEGEMEKARRKLRSLAKPGGLLIERAGRGGGVGGGIPATFHAAHRPPTAPPTGTDAENPPTTPTDRPRQDALPQVTAPTAPPTAPTARSVHAFPPAYKAGEAGDHHHDSDPWGPWPTGSEGEAATP